MELLDTNRIPLKKSIVLIYLIKKEAISNLQQLDLQLFLYILKIY